MLKILSLIVMSIGMSALPGSFHDDSIISDPLNQTISVEYALSHSEVSEVSLFISTVYPHLPI